MIRMQKVSESTFNDFLYVWNEGWKGYFIDMTMDMNKLLRRFPIENLSAELSYIAYDGNLPVGFVLNGVREVKGKLVAWNGGTAVIPEYRKRGVGRQLIEQALQVYREQQVDIARLEAILENAKAIELYKSTRYTTFENLAHIQFNPENHSASLSDNLHKLIVNDGSEKLIEALSFKVIAAGEIEELDLYRANAPWQAQWFNVNQPEALLITQRDGQPLGYMLYNQVKNPRGERIGVNIYQFEARSTHEFSEQAIYSTALKHLVDHLSQELKITAAYISEEKQVFTELLLEVGFKTFARQVHMEKQMKNTGGIF